MTKRALVVIVLLATVVAVVLGINPLARYLLNHHFLPSGMQMTCLEFSANLNAIEIEKACLTDPGFTLVIEDVVRTHQGKINVKRALLNHTPKEQSNPAQNPALPALPDLTGLPEFRIQQFIVDSPLLEHSITTAISHKEGRAIISGALDARLDIQSNQLTIRSEVRPRTLIDLLPRAQRLEIQDMFQGLMDAQYPTVLIWQAEKISGQIDLPQTALTLAECGLTVTAAGSLKAHYLVQTDTFTVDPGYVTTELTRFGTCLPTWLQAPQQIVITLPSVEVTSSPLSITANDAMRLSGDGVAFSLHNIRASETEVDAQLQATVIASRLSPSVTGSIQLNGRVNFKPDKKALSLKTELAAQQIAMDDQTQGFTLPALEADAALKWDVSTQQIDAQVTSRKFAVTHPQLTMADNQITLTAQGVLSDPEVRLTWQQGAINHDMFSFTATTHQLQGHGGRYTGRSDLKQLNTQWGGFSNISITHQINTHSGLASHHQLQLNEQIKMQLNTTPDGATLRLPATSITAFKSYITPYASALSLQQGQIKGDAHLLWQSPVDSIEANVEAINIGGSWQEYRFSGVQTELSATTDSGQLQLAPFKLTAKHIDTGFIFTDVVLNIAQHSEGWQLKDGSANALGGQISVDGYSTFAQSQTVTLSATGIELQKLIDLEEKAQIQVSGKAAATIPLTLEEGTFTVSGGKLWNQTDGYLNLSNNAGVQGLIAQNPQLKPIAEMTFSKMQSGIQLDKSGQLTLPIELNGVSLSTGDEVNFNPSIELNLMDLLKINRLTKQIEQSVKDKMQRSQQKENR